MSREVDERIVEMQFDNKQFESGVSQTLKSLDKLHESLKFEGISKSVSAIQNGINRLDINPIANSAAAIESAYTTLAGKIKVEVFDRIAKWSVDTGEKIFKSLFSDGAKAGMQEYETQQGAIQTILANTQHLGTTVKDVNKALDELNEYADLTIYNFTEMTRNIGTFTAAGLDLDTSTQAIKGIANLAAISGSTSQQAANAMYQLSQALAAGTVNLQDWNSVVNAGMGGKVFQDALKKTGRHMGAIIDESKSFRESIGSKDGSAWLTAEILSETLKQLSGDMTDAELAAQGWSQKEIKEIQDLAKTAIEAATVVKTFGQLTDTVEEQIGSGWTRTWQTIFGDFEESKALWTGVYKAISPYIDAMSDLRNQHLQFWKENEGRDKVIQAFSNLWSGITETVDSFTDSFRKAFPIVDNFGQVLLDLSDRFLAFSERFKSVKKTAESGIVTVTKMVSSISDAEKEAAKAIWYSGKYGNGEERRKNLEAEGLSYKNVQTYLEALIETNFDAAEADKKFMTSVQETTKASEELAKVESHTALNNIITTMSNFATVIKNMVSDAKKIGSALNTAFSKVFSLSSITDKIASISDYFRDLSDSVRITDSALTKITRIGTGVFSVFKMIGDAIYGAAQAVFELFGKALPTISDMGGNALESAASLGDFLYTFSQTHDISKIVHDAILNVVSVFEAIPSKVSSATAGMRDFFDLILDKIKNATGLDVRGVLAGIKNVIVDILSLNFKGAFSTVTDAFVGFKTTLETKLAEVDPNTLFGKFISGMRSIVDTIRGIFSNLFSINSADDTVASDVEERFNLFRWIGESLSSVGEFVSEAVAFISEAFSQLFDFIGGFLFAGIEEDDSAFEKVKKVISNIGEILKQVFDIVAPFIGLGIAKDLASYPKAMSGFLESVGDAIESVTNRFTGKASTVDLIKSIAATLLILSASVAIFALMDEKKLSFAVGAMTFIIGELIGSLAVMQRYLKHDIDYALITVAMSKIAKAMLVMTLSVAILAKKDPIGIAASVGAITAMLAALVGAMIAMQKWLNTDIKFDKVTGIFSKLAWAILLLSVSVAVVSGRDSMAIATGTASIITMLYALIGAIALLEKIASNISSTDANIKNIGYLAGIMFTIAQSTRMLIKPIMQLSDLGYDKMWMGIAGVTSLILMLSGVVYLLSQIDMDKNAASIALSLIVAAIAVKSLAKAAVDLGEEGGDKIVAATGGIFAMVGALGAMIAVMALISKISNPAQILASSVALIAAVLAVNGLIPTMLLLSNIDSEDLTKSLIGLGVAMLSLAAILAALSAVGGVNVLLVATALFILSGAVTMVVPSMIKIGNFVIPIIEKLTKTNWKTLGKGLALVGVGLLAMLVAAPILALFGAGLLVIGAALTLISVSILVASRAFLQFASALQTIADIWPYIKDMLPELGSALGLSFTNFLSSFIDGLRGVLEQIRDLAPEIAETIKSVVISVFDMLLGLVPTIASYLLQLFISTLQTFVEDLPVILNLIGQVIAIILTWVGENIKSWTETLVQILMDFLIGIFDGLSSRVDELVASITNFIIAVLNALANNMKTKGDDVLDAIENFLSEFFILMGKGIKRVFSTIEEIGGDVIDYIVTGLEEAGGDAIDTVVTVFTEDIPNALKEVWEDIKQIGKDLVNNIKDGIIEAKDDLIGGVKSFGEEALDCLAVGWGVRSPSKETEALGEYFVEGATNAVNDNGYTLTDATEGMADDALGAFADTLQNNMADMDTTFTPNFKITPDAEFDLTNVESEYSDLDLDSAFADTNLAASFTDAMDFSSLLSNATAKSDEQRHADTEANNELLGTLNASIGALVDKLENGMINIPDNATFEVPVNIDGKAVANATAAYLDVINGQKLDLESRGVTSR